MNIVVLITASNDAEARTVAEKLVGQKLAACVNIIPKVRSVFWWEGKIDQAEEQLLIVKSRKNLLNKVIKEVRFVHSYNVPEIIALPIIGGNKDYLGWINESIVKK